MNDILNDNLIILNIVYTPYELFKKPPCQCHEHLRLCECSFRIYYMYIDKLLKNMNTILCKLYKSSMDDVFLETSNFNLLFKNFLKKQINIPIKFDIYNV